MLVNAHTPPHREFLGWDGPALPAAVDFLAGRYRDGAGLDMSSVLVVVPGQRAGRRLAELLAFHADDHGLLFTPPAVVTEGHLPERLYAPRGPFADDLAQRLAWAQALAETPDAYRRALAPTSPQPKDVIGWLPLAGVLQRLHAELGADGLTFADVARRGAQTSGFPEQPRWEALAEVQRRYAQMLAAQGLCDRETERRAAIDRGAIRTDLDVILVGTADLNGILRCMLGQIAERVTAFVMAPAARADDFDALGCLIPERWVEAEVPLADSQLRQVDGPGDQADAVAAWLAELSGRYSSDEVAIGVPDESLVPQLQRQLEQCGARGRWVSGRRLRESPPFRLLAAAVAFAGRRRYEDLGALVRHPDVESWLRPASPVADAPSLPAQLDRYYNERLPNRVRASHIAASAEKWPDLLAAVARIEEWLAPAEAPRPLRDWADVFRKILAAVYDNQTLNLARPSDEVAHRSLCGILDACDRVAALPAELDRAPVTAADAFQTVLAPAGAESIPPPAEAGAVELLGWLELPLDDAPALAVTSFNDGFVPQSSGADPFLPDRLRADLGLPHQQRRHARDVYAATVLCHSRKDLLVVFARRDARNDPLRPSPLLFAGPDSVLLTRAARFFDTGPRPSAPRRPLLAGGRAPLPTSQFEVPRPVRRGRRPDRVTVTEFKSYLACPYRYYLRHVCKLAAVDDAARELDGGGFGSLVHRTLGAFGSDPAGPRWSERAAEIFDYLDDRLTSIAQRAYGDGHRRPAIRLQLEQLRRRLRAFAKRQAALVREGWRIVYTEDQDTKSLSIPFLVDGEPIALAGKIDRIDANESLRIVRVLDYKTGDEGKSPQKTHRKGDAWVDLQLPLYRHLCLAAIGPERADWAVQLGYFNLAKAADATDIELADWDAAVLASADCEAQRVIRLLREETFWEPNYPAPAFGEEFAAICLDAARSRPALGDGDGGAA